MLLKGRAVRIVAGLLCIVFLGYCTLKPNHAWAALEVASQATPRPMPVLHLYTQSNEFIPFGQPVMFPSGIFCPNRNSATALAAIINDPGSAAGRSVGWAIAFAGCKRLQHEVFVIQGDAHPASGIDSNGLVWEQCFLHVVGLDGLFSGFIPY